MPERALSRIGSVSAIVGAILLIVANILHPRGAPFGDTKAHLQEIAGSGIYLGDHIGIAVGALLVVGGLVAIYRSITAGAGAACARLGFAAALASAALITVVIAIDGIAIKAVATAWASSQDPALFQAAFVLEQVGVGLFSMLIFLFFGVTFILYGLAVALSDVYPKWLGWAALVLGIVAALIGLVQAYNGPSTLLTNQLFPIASVLLTVWVLVMGVLLWRRAGASAAA